LMGAVMCSANSGALHDPVTAVPPAPPEVRSTEKREPCEWCDADR